MKITNTTAKEIFHDVRLAALADAAAKGNAGEVERLVQAGVPVDGRGDQGMTPLAFALFSANAKGVETLLKLGANPNHRMDDAIFVGRGVPIIMFLPSHDSASLLEVLLKYGADVNTRMPVKVARAQRVPYLGDSLLIQSVMNLNNVKTLVKYGADINIVPHPDADSTGHASAAVVAARLGQFDVVEYLVAHGAKDLDRIAHALQARPWSPEFKARRNEILMLLKSRGAKIYSAYKPSRSPDVESYPPQDTPQAWLSPGYYEVKEDTSDRPVVIKDVSSGDGR